MLFQNLTREFYFQVKSIIGAEETTRSFGGIRITIAWKLFTKQS